MLSNSSKALFVLDILRRETDAEHRLSAPALLKRLEEHGIRAERRSIYRAVDALRAHGERIEKTPTGYYYAREAPDKNDLYALTAAVQAASFLSDARKQALFRALGALWGARAAEETISCGAAIVAASARNDAPFMAMLTASQAIAAGKQLTFSASLPEPGGYARLRVNPYALFFKEGVCWLVCNVEGEYGLSRFPLFPLSGARVERQPRRHISEVSPYIVRFDAEKAMQDLAR